MATLRVAEFAGVGSTDLGVPILAAPALAEQSVTVSASGVILTAPFQPNTRFIEMCTDTTCSVFIGLYSTLSTSSVTTGNGRINANERVIRAVPGVPAWGPGSNVQPSPYGLVAIVAV